MYIRRSTRAYKGKTYTNYVLVEAVQTPKGPRQKTICSLGDLSPRPREEWLKLAHKLEHALAGQGELLAGLRPNSIVRPAPSMSATNSGAGSDWTTSCATSVEPAARAGSPAPPSSIG